MRARVVVLALAAAALPAVAAAQNAGTGLGAGRVSAASATIYARCDTSSPARATLKRGDGVTVEAVNEAWVNVRVDATGERGCLRRSELEASPVIERASEARRAREIARARGGASVAPAPPIAGGRAMRIAAFGTAGWFNATATKSFDAILDKHAGVEIGAGAQVAWQRGTLRGLFVEVGASTFEETGERVFIDDGEVFKLGIPLTISLTPIEVTGGYRMSPVRRRGGRVSVLPVAYFAGGGVGTLSYKESDDDGDVSERFTTYHVMGGADATLWKGLLVGGEVRYRWVPDGLGAGGVSDEFNETDLGGLTVRARIGFAF